MRGPTDSPHLLAASVPALGAGACPARRAEAATTHDGHAAHAHGRPRRARRVPRRHGRPRAPTASTRTRSCATSTAGTTTPAARAAASLREWSSSPSDKEIEVAPGVKFAAWTYNGRIPGPTLRAPRGRARCGSRFVNGSAHPHTIHFHGIHPAAMDGVPGLGAGEIAPGEHDGLRVRRRAVRPAPLPLPRPAARRAHRQGPVRRVHHRPEGRPRRTPTRWSWS